MHKVVEKEQACNLNMASMDRVMELNFRSTDEESYFQESHDWVLPHVFQDARHVEKIQGQDVPPQGWRMKERMKTVSVALVLCLNVGVDPPGLIKLQPCARFECWVDPLSLSPQKALENIGQNLQKQYERWQPRARYKQSLDPTVDEVKKLCVSLRRNAKEERVLFHYNGHGVPCPTTNGEVWVFNRNYTQYIPLSVYDLQTWMGYPSIYVYDCNNAGVIIKSFHQFAEQHEREYYSEAGVNDRGGAGDTTRSSTPPPPNYASCIQLGACSDKQVLPMNPDLPADLFTACLTTPIRMALRWFVLQNQCNAGIDRKVGFNKLLSDGITLETVEKVPGQLNDRRTMLGELNWIFTAITDTIAWNILPRALFQKLFRQDLLVASLFRNFLLAERIMRSYDCTPVSSPKLPPTSHHPMWHAWDYALDQCLSQLRKQDAPVEQFVHIPSPFFEEQLTAFEVWLTLGNEKRNPPEQLPIVLQVLLSQVHRVRALELLGKFLDLGWWAVNLALSVGIFPYVLKLLQSSAKELRPLLVFIWAKILAVDQTCQTDLVRDGSHKYFIQMVGDNTLSYEYRGELPGQQGSLVSLALEETPAQSTQSISNLHKWVCICLGLTWQDFQRAVWGSRLCSRKLPLFERREGCSVFALGSFVNGMERTEHSNSIDHSVVLMILNKLADNEASSLVRQELVVALHNFVLVFENHFVSVCEKQLAQQQELYCAGLGIMSPINLRRISSNSARMRALAAAGNSNLTITGAEAYGSNAAGGDSMRRVASSSSLSNLTAVGLPSSALQSPREAPSPSSSTVQGTSSVGGIYTRVWASLLAYERDPHQGVSILARSVIEYIKSKAYAKTQSLNKSFQTRELESSTEALSKTSSTASTPTRTTQPPLLSTPVPITPVIATRYINWCWSQFSKPCNTVEVVDPQDPAVYTRAWVYSKNAKVRRDCFKRVKNFPGKIEEQVVSKNLNDVLRPGMNTTVSFHPYENLVVVGGGFLLDGGSAPGSVSGSLSSLNVTGLGQSVVVDKSVFLVFEYDDTTHLSSLNMSTSSHRRRRRPTSSNPQSPFQVQPRVINRTEIEHVTERVRAVQSSDNEWLNPHDSIVTRTCSLLAAGCNDACVRVYKPCVESKTSVLVTAWSLGNTNRVNNLLMKYEHEQQRLVVSYHGARNTNVGVWDLGSERMVREIGGAVSDKLKSDNVGSSIDFWVTCLDAHRCGQFQFYSCVFDENSHVKMQKITLISEPNVFVIGGEDGSVRLLDLRVPPSECVTTTWRDFNANSSIQNVRLRHDRSVVAGCSNGRVRFFDLRSKSPTKTIDTTVDVTVLDIHPNLPYFAIGTASSTVNVYGFHGQTAFLSNSIREGFGGFGRIGLANNSISCVAFHEFKPFVSFLDSYGHFSVYKARK
ncbi:Regulatory-associated protein of mTOR [Orchesella cincta]|uniref:Regulatory-associated protein of mTOR n=1 Tax=Orchesella cincta TaxID=48709 RepID=A0A1D2MME6_ORCCI|nr:Regulatory-associated protein of mTOR [Orchesella cincta]